MNDVLVFCGADENEVRFNGTKKPPALNPDQIYRLTVNFLGQKWYMYTDQVKEHGTIKPFFRYRISLDSPRYVKYLTEKKENFRMELGMKEGPLTSIDIVPRNEIQK